MINLPAFTVFDVETTGLDPRKGHKIIEIAGVRVEEGKICEDRPFLSLVNPERTIPPEAQQVNKIANVDVANAPTIDNILPAFLEFAQGSILVAHNAEFDMGFMEREKECCWGYVELPECLCTLQLSRLLYPGEFRHNLDAVAERFQLQLEKKDRHRALPDVLLTAQALLQMLNEHNIRNIEELREKSAIRRPMTA